MKFQRKFILDVFDYPHGARRAYLSVARKDGKSVQIQKLLKDWWAGGASHGSWAMSAEDMTVATSLWDNPELKPVD